MKIFIRQVLLISSVFYCISTVKAMHNPLNDEMVLTQLKKYESEISMRGGESLTVFCLRRIVPYNWNGNILSYKVIFIMDKPQREDWDQNWYILNQVTGEAFLTSTQYWNLLKEFENKVHVAKSSDSSEFKKKVSNITELSSHSQGILPY